MEQLEKLNRISIINVKNKLNLNEICTIGNNIYIKCPFCNSEKADMKLNTENNTYVCKNCEEAGSSISLFAKCKELTNKQAYIYLLKMKADLDTKNSITISNVKKDIDELDEIYNKFLGMLSLNTRHLKKLIELEFSIDEIKKIGFKTIPTNENEKIIICSKLLECGYTLDGIPGFYQNSKFQWTFSSHKGFFIPIINNMKIAGLRIHLDGEYNTHTTDIWFSSNGKYNGTKMSNDIMILRPKNTKFRMIDSKKDKEDIIIATEMLLAYKLHFAFENNLIIGLPNVITKNEMRKLCEKDEVNNIFLVMDQHTILHNSNSVIKKLEDIYGEEKINLNFSVRCCDIPNKLKESFNQTANFNQTEEFIEISA